MLISDSFISIFTTTIEKVKDEIKDMMNEKIDTLESRIFDLELSNDKLNQENDIMKNHISRQEDRMDGLEDGLNLCFQEKNDLEQYCNFLLFESLSLALLPSTASVTEDSCSCDSVIVAVFTDILFGCSLSDIIDHKHNLT
jgi:hypothetical protein